MNDKIRINSYYLLLKRICICTSSIESIISLIQTTGIFSLQIRILPGVSG